MRRVLLGVALAVGLVAMALTGGAPPAEAPPVREAGPAPMPSLAPMHPLLRNPFEFGSRPTEPAASPATPLATTRSEAPPEPMVSPVRLVGFVVRGQSPQAALVVEGETVLLAVGESALGYTLVSADEGEGVVLTAPDGSTLRVPVAE